MRSSDFPSATWRKSSRSNHGGNGNCVEVAELAGRIALRDSKHRGGPELSCTPAGWAAFTAGVRNGEFG